MATGAQSAKTAVDPRHRRRAGAARALQGRLKGEMGRRAQHPFRPRDRGRSGARPGATWSAGAPGDQSSRPRSRAQARFLRADPTWAMWITWPSPWLASPYRIGPVPRASASVARRSRSLPVRQLVLVGTEDLVDDGDV